MRPRSSALTTFLIGGLALLLLLSLWGCETEEEPTGPREIEFSNDGVLEFLDDDMRRVGAIHIEIADTDSARQRGLMERRSIPSQSGMLFIFDDEDDRSFWMRNTYIPLDVIFVDSDSQVVNVVERTRPLSDDQILSDGPAKYVVEVRAGAAERLGVNENTRIRWHRREQEP